VKNEGLFTFLISLNPSSHIYVYSHDAASAGNAVLQLLSTAQVRYPSLSLTEMTLTRYRLKCDRDEPCSNCVARNVSCQYAPWPRGRVAAQRRDSRQPDLNDRVRHLEQLLGSIVSQLPAGQQQQQQSTSVASPSIKSPASTYVTTQASLQSNGEGCEVKPGRMMANPNETIYVSSSHWSAICHEVTLHIPKLRINLIQRLAG
jgi:hypothetical protein